MAFALCVVYALTAFLVAMSSYSSVGVAVDVLGQRALSTVQEMAGTGGIRGWATGEAADAAIYLKSLVAGLDDESPGRIEAMHQRVPLSSKNMDGPFGDPVCLNISTEPCIGSWGKRSSLSSLECAVECPFNRTAKAGPRCCGEQVGQGGPLPIWSSVVAFHGAKLDLPDPEEGGEVFFDNIVFRVKGDADLGEGSAILVSAHYDSVAGHYFPYKPGQDPGEPTDHGPGVGDDLAGVAVMLEVARALAKAPPLPRDVIFSFVSGEEAGCMGSTLFRQLHPWSKRPGFVINLEGKGKANSKEWLVRANSAYAAGAYARFALRPAGFSIAEWILGNLNVGYTDLDLYRRSGYHGMDLVYVHDSYVYHTPNDNVDVASAEGLQHEGTNVLSIVQGVAQDRSFPGLRTKAEDPVVGVWNNEFHKDPGISSHTFYVALFDTWMWFMPMASAQVLFLAAAVMSPILVLCLLWCASAYSLTPFSRVLTGTCTDVVAMVAYVIMGTLTAVVFGLMVIDSRDLRTWYDWQVTRLSFLALSGVVPGLLVELARRAGVCCGTEYKSSDQSAFLGAVLTYAGFLLVCAFGLPHFSFLAFPFVALAPVGVGLSLLLQALLPASREAVEDAERRLLPLSEKGAMHAVAQPFSAQDWRWDVMIRAAAVPVAVDLVTILLPLLLALPQVFNLLDVLSYIVDGIGAQVANGALCGLSGSVLALPFIPALRRLSLAGLRAAALLAVALWVTLMVACLLVPTNGKAYCYFDANCD